MKADRLHAEKSVLSFLKLQKKVTVIIINYLLYEVFVWFNMTLYTTDNVSEGKFKKSYHAKGKTS